MPLVEASAVTESPPGTTFRVEIGPGRYIEAAWSESRRALLVRSMGTLTRMNIEPVVGNEILVRLVDD